MPWPPNRRALPIALTSGTLQAWLATLVEWRYSKSQILEAYLNEIYLGQRGSLAIRGVGAACRAYFAKEAHQLTLTPENNPLRLTRRPEHPGSCTTTPRFVA